MRRAKRTETSQLWKAVCAKAGMAEDAASDPRVTPALAGHPGQAQPNRSAAARKAGRSRTDPGGSVTRKLGWAVQVGGLVGVGD